LQVGHRLFGGFVEHWALQPQINGLADDGTVRPPVADRVHNGDGNWNIQREKEKQEMLTPGKSCDMLTPISIERPS
jgi:hypothetical protein